MAILHIPENLYSRIVERASKLKTSPDIVAIQALQNYLWQTELEVLLATIHARTRHIPSEEIEADITAAAEEVRQQRCANHRSA